MDKAHTKCAIKKSIGITMLALLLASGVGAVPVEEWNRTFGGLRGDQGTYVQQTLDGYIILGTTYSYGAGDVDVWLIKADESGNEIWNKTFGGINSDYATAFQETSDKGYIISGITYSFGVGEGDMWLIKTDESGNEIWNKTFGGIGYDSAHSVQQTYDGGFVIAGGTYSYAGSDGVWLIKTDESGNEIWNKTFGGQGNRWASSVQQTSDGGYIIAGQKGTYPYTSADTDMWLIKTNESGNEIWNKTFGGEETQVANFVRQTSEGGYIISGFADTSDGIRHILLIKTNESGNEVWNRIFRRDRTSIGGTVQQTSDLGYILAGWTSLGMGDAWLIKMDESGNEMWNKTFGGNDYDWAFSVQQTSDGGYIMAGFYSSYVAEGEVWIIKVSSDPIKFIKGTVKDNSTGDNLAGVTVSANTTLSTTTNATGFYSFAVTNGTYDLISMYDVRYYTNITAVSTIGQAVVWQDIELIKKPTGNITGSVIMCCTLT